MANTASAIKRIRQNERRRLRNRVHRNKARTFVKKARVALESGEPNAARVATLEAIKSLDKAASKGIIHKNNAGRRKGRLMKHLAAIEKQA